jgi:hypothetical protein
MARNFDKAVTITYDAYMRMPYFMRGYFDGVMKKPWMDTDKTAYERGRHFAAIYGSNAYTPQLRPSKKALAVLEQAVLSRALI